MKIYRRRHKYTEYLKTVEIVDEYKVAPNKDNQAPNRIISGFNLLWAIILDWLGGSG